jgi:hypothetical protein
VVKERERETFSDLEHAVLGPFVPGIHLGWELFGPVSINKGIRAQARLGPVLFVFALPGSVWVWVGLFSAISSFVHARLMEHLRPRQFSFAA